MESLLFFSLHQTSDIDKTRKKIRKYFRLVFDGDVEMWRHGD
jgi:hypothetical protein